MKWIQCFSLFLDHNHRKIAVMWKYLRNYRFIRLPFVGNAGDSLARQRGNFFSTKDRDNDIWHDNCAVRFKGAWWYNDCHNSNLNGLYHRGRHSSFADGVNWYHWKGYNYSAKRAEMKLKPVNF